MVDGDAPGRGESVGLRQAAQPTDAAPSVAPVSNDVEVVSIPPEIPGTVPEEPAAKVPNQAAQPTVAAPSRARIFNDVEVVSIPSESPGAVLGAPAAEEPEDIEGGLESQGAREARMNREAIIQGLLSGRACWENRFLLDLWFYLKQTHVLISILGCHKMHPFQIWERAIVECAALMGSYGVVIMFMDPKTGNEEEGSSIWLEAAYASFCVSCFTTIASKSLTCACFQPGSCCPCRGLRFVAEGVGRCLAINCTLLSACILALGIAIGHHHELSFKRATASWALAQAVNLKWGLLFEFLSFSYAYWKETRGNKSASKYPHGPSYPKDLEMLWGGDRCSCHRCRRGVPVRCPDQDQGQESEESWS